MWPRGQIDISFSTLFGALVRCLLPATDRAGLGGAFFCSDIPLLSVRSGFDLLLRTLSDSRRRDIVASPITVPAMEVIARENGFRLIPAEADRRTLYPSVEACRAALTDNTGMLLLAPLAGARPNPDPYRRLADEHHLLLVEDRAQAFDGRHTGHGPADVTLFSFGPIKRLTCSAGAVAVVPDPQLRAQMERILEGDPGQTRSDHFRRLVRLAGLRLMSCPLIFTQVVKLLADSEGNYDSRLSAGLKSFRDGDLMMAIRKRPHPLLVKLLRQRLRRATPFEYEAGAARIRAMLAELPDTIQPVGAAHSKHSFWLLMVQVPEPDRLVAEMRRNGFDATRRHRLAAIAGHAEVTSSLSASVAAAEILDSVVFLPCCPAMPDSELQRMAAVLKSAAGG